jgi:phenylalanyl-tRNA synthetase beta chain
MNILIPHQWLLEHLDTKATPKKIQEILSLSGPSVEHIYRKQQEEVYDIEVTTNRVDSMSIRGIAREAAVILSQAGIPSQLKSLKLKNQKELIIQGESLPLPQINNNPEISKRVLCVILKNVKKTPTPNWMAKRLLQTDMNVHDSVIDITNYITHELGHPCHAFDYDKLMKSGGVINIVEAEKNEKFTTLDGLDFVTVGGEVVFKNAKNEIIDLPSIKGTANTSIDDNTTNVLLLLESIIAPKVRFASMTHAIRTTAAQLMEKNVDPNLAELVLLRGIELYQQLCKAQIGSQIFDDFPVKTVPAANKY